MEKFSKRTVYIGVEVVAESDAEASTKSLSLLGNLKEKGSIVDYEVFLSDEHDLKDTKKVIREIIFEGLRLKYLAEEVNGYVKPLLELITKIVSKDK